jgi:Right handed beta helix region
MKRICSLLVMIGLAALGANAQSVPGIGVIPVPVVVNCDQGQSLNSTLSRLERRSPVTVLVQGTCTEYVQINGFERLTLKGLPGATLQQPSKDPGNGLVVHVLLIDASRSITIDGFAIHSRASALGDIGIGRNSIDVQLRNLTVDGPSAFGIFVFESSQVSLAEVTARDPGFATVGVVDISDVHIESCLFENSTGASFREGLFVASGHVTMQTTTIRNMQHGIDISRSGSVDIQSFNSYFPISFPTDVIIENPAGTNFNGVFVGSGSLLNLGDTKLRITNPGQPWGGNTGGVSVSDGGTLSAGGNLIISGSQGQGIFVSNNSHASLAGSSITGSAHGGLVVTNLSTVAVGGSNPLTQISGNGTDLFCDSRSLITGGANIANATNVQCGNLLPGDTVPLP